MLLLFLVLIKVFFLMFCLRTCGNSTSSIYHYFALILHELFILLIAAVGCPQVILFSFGKVLRFFIL